MKKLLGLLLVAVIAFPANAAVIKNVELKGEVQTIASDVKYGLDDMYNRGAWTRAIAGLSFDVVEDVKANLLFQYAYAWGDNNYLNNGFESAEGMRLVNANLVLSNLFCCLEATVGRQFYGEDNSPIIYFGPNHYNAEGGLATALDAVTVRYSDDFKAFTVIAGKIADTTKGFIAMEYGNEMEVRGNIWGADLKLNLTDSLTAQLYGYDITDLTLYDYTNEVITPVPTDFINKHFGFYGAKLGWDSEVFRASAEYARNFNGHRLIKESKDTGYMVKADIAADINAFTARGTFVYSANGFISLGNYAPGLMFGHLAGNYGFVANIFNMFANEDENGLRMFNVGFDVRPSEKWTVSLDGYSFQGRTGKHSATYEIDLTAKYAYNEYVEVFGGLAYAKHGFGWKEDHSENYKGQLGMLVRF